MDERPPEPQVDARSVRFELGAMTVLLLGGYVFGIIYVVPGLAAVLGVALGVGPKGNLFRRLFEGVANRRLKPPTVTEPAGVVRFSELFGLTMLSVATLFWIVGLGPLAWLVALIEAGICALQATTGLSVEAAVRDRLLGKRRR
ncbi:MAG TPA: DUF4395 family protein [Acidimicrobiia bacterium]